LGAQTVWQTPFIMAWRDHLSSKAKQQAEQSCSQSSCRIQFFLCTFLLRFVQRPVHSSVVDSDYLPTQVRCGSHSQRPVTRLADLRRDVSSIPSPDLGRSGGEPGAVWCNMTCIDERGLLSASTDPSVSRTASTSARRHQDLVELIKRHCGREAPCQGRNASQIADFDTDSGIRNGTFTVYSSDHCPFRLVPRLHGFETFRADTCHKI
jgi:hypothetical protein